MTQERSGSGEWMRWSILAAIGLSALFTLAWFAQRRGEAPVSPSAQTAQGPAQSNGRLGAASPAAQPSGDPVQAARAADGSVVDPQVFLSPPDRPSLMAHPEGIVPVLPPASRYVRRSETTLFDALSPEDAAWLADHGYPTFAEVDGLAAQAEQGLALRAAEGDLGAQVLLGMKQNGSGRFKNGYSNIGDAAARGSTFALAALAKDQQEAGNVVESAAWQRVAMMRGDWRAAEFVGYKGPELSPWQVQQADRYAIRYMLNLEHRRRELGLGPFNNTLRPGFDWRAPESGDQVGVYDRSGR